MYIYTRFRTEASADFWEFLTMSPANVTKGDGAEGPLIYVFGEGTVPEKIIDELNEKFAGEIFILSSGKHTHFMDGQITVDMWQKCFTPAFARRRQVLGLDLSARGALLFDGFTGNWGQHWGRERLVRLGICTSPHCFRFLSPAEALDARG